MAVYLKARRYHLSCFFFNADLVQGLINKNRGSIAFIDDFTAWVTGDSIAQNVRSLQSSVIPHLKDWAYQSAAVFNPEKTVLVHFTRNKTKLLEEGRVPTYIEFGQEKPKT